LSPYLDSLMPTFCEHCSLLHQSENHDKTDIEMLVVEKN